MYVSSLACILIFGLAAHCVEAPFAWLFWLAALGSGYFTVSSLAVSFWVYDWSGFYRWKWLPDGSPRTVLNIHAGFDESSGALRHCYPGAEMTVLDFYDPAQHTEPSIARARAFLPPVPGTRACSTAHLPLEEGSQDLVFLIFAAHEIRDAAERCQFFRELRRVCRGQIYLVEHQRDLANFLAFGPGFLHFHSPDQWRRSWSEAGLQCVEERFFTPFVRIFVLEASTCSN